MEVVYVFRIGQLGDTLVALPAISRIREIHKNSRMILITNEPDKNHYVTAWDVLKHTGYFESVIFYNKSFSRISELIRNMRNNKNSILYYITPDRPKISIIRDWLFFSIIGGSKKNIGLKSMFFRYGRNKSKPAIIEKEFERILKIVDRSKTHSRPPFLHPHDDVIIKVDSLLLPFKSNDFLVCIGPGSKMPAKKWHLENYIEMANRLLLHHIGIGIILSGGQEDWESCEIIKKLNPERILNFCGKTDIIESAYLISRTRLYIGNDTGTMHLAASMGVPCIGIYSSRDVPIKWEPYGENNVIVRKDIECSGCMLTECNNNMKCLSLISVEEVWTKVEEILSKRCLKN